MNIGVNNQLEDLLNQGLQQMGLSFGDHSKKQLIAYVELLSKWNAAYNLTAVRNPKEMVVKHLLDSLSILPWIKGKNILDVGTGAGIPGIPLAICMPDTQWTLLDSNSKKTRFLRQVVSELKLSNVKVSHSRIENFSGVEFDQITCRAFASLYDFYMGIKTLFTEHTELLAMKGIDPVQEIDELEGLCQIKDTVKLSVPFLDEERHLVIIQSTGN